MSPPEIFYRGLKEIEIPDRKFRNILTPVKPLGVEFILILILQKP